MLNQKYESVWAKRIGLSRTIQAPADIPENFLSYLAGNRQQRFPRLDGSMNRLRKGKMFRYIDGSSIIVAGLQFSPNFIQQAHAQTTVECRSRNYQFDEYYTGGLSKSQLNHQTSGIPSWYLLFPVTKPTSGRNSTFPRCADFPNQFS